jgi:hypothetical protein
MKKIILVVLVLVLLSMACTSGGDGTKTWTPAKNEQVRMCDGGKIPFPVACDPVDDSLSIEKYKQILESVK